MSLPTSIGFDLETEGDLPEYALQPFRATEGKARIKAASISIGEEMKGALYPDLFKVRNMLLYALRTDKYVVGWNVAFDAAWCIAVGLEEVVFKVKWLDAMLLWRHAVVEPEGEDVPRAKRKSYSLESAMHEFYPDDVGFKEFNDFQATDQASLDLLLNRNKKDAYWTTVLAGKFWDMLTKEQQRAALIEARCIPLIAKTKVLGINSSDGAARELANKLMLEAVSVYRELLSTSPEVQGLNLNSTQQLQKLIYDTWGLTADRFSKKTNNPSTDKYALFDLAVLDPRANLLKKLREAKNNRKKYAIGTINSLAYNGDGKVRPQAKIFSTYTSRITYGSSDKAARQFEKTTKKSGLQVITKKVEVPVGVALHQWKRGKEYRRLIKPPPGYLLAEFDAAGQEFRWMAVASGDETMLSLCAPGEDAHGYMGAQVASCDYRELVQKVKDGDVEAANERKCGKFCIAEGEMVLTDQGLVPIEKVSLYMRVWDGVEWVSHEGLIFQGIKEVITYDGLTATQNHMVYLGNGKCCTIWEAVSAESSLAQTGDGRREIRISFNSIDESDQRRGAEGIESAMLVPEMPDPIMGECHQPESREDFEVQGVCVTGAAPEQRTCCDQQRGCVESTEALQRHATAMHESERSVVPELWREGDRVSIPKCVGGDCSRLEGSVSPDLPRLRHRPEGQQRPLRTWEPPTGYADREPQQQAQQSVSRLQRAADPSQARIPCITYIASRGEVYGASGAELGVQRPEYPSDSRAVGSPKLQTKRVYDLANAGPRHRFTVSGRLVANCNLSYQYRVSAKTATTKARVDYELDVDENFIKRTQFIYRSSYVGVGGPPTQRTGGYWASQIEKCKRLSYAETFAGRRVQLKGSWAGRDAWAMESTSINYPIQGTGGDQKYLAMAIARNMLPEFGGYFYYELHDGLFFIFPEEKALKASEVFRDKLSNLPYKKAWGIDLSIKFPFDAKIGTSWGDLTALEKWGN